MTNTVSESTILPISEIAILSDVNIRELDTDYVDELMQAQVEYGESHWQTHWKEKPKINQDGILFSGFHTITAAKHNFGNTHKVSFEVVEGDPYLLAACENAVHGKRRTNADKRAAVLRWLQNDEGKQWTNSHIAKQCHVSDMLVNDVNVSLQENGSDTYERPTKRKYIDKHGNVTWMETAKINEATGEPKEVISGEMSTGEVITEITINELWKQINPAISAWKKEREGVGHASKTMFIHATLRWEGLPSDTETSVKILKELLRLLTTKETNILEELIRKQLDGKSLWDDASVGVETVEQETEQPSQTAEEREANKLRKQKKQVVKSIWDKRKQASRDWLGTEDNDLTTYTDLDALEKAFVAYEEHAYCADAFQSGMRRAAEQTFNICLEKTLSSDVSLEVLEAEYKAVSTYALDILQWKNQEWIQQLIAAKKAKASGDTDEHKTLLEKVKAEVPKWKARYKKSGKEESELISRADLSALIHVYRNWENASGTAMEEEAATAEELEELLTLLTDDYYSFIYRLRDYLTADSDRRSPDTEGLSKEFRRIFTLHARFARDIVDCRKLGETYHIDEQDVVEMMGDFQRELGALEQAVRKQIKASDADISVEDIASRVEVDDIEVVKAMVSKVQLDEAKRPSAELPLQNALDEMKAKAAAPPDVDMNALWEAFNKRFPKWKAKYAESGYKENSLIQGATEAELFDALRVYRESDRTGPVTAEEIKDVTDLMKRQSYPYAKRLRDVLREKASEDEEGFAEIDRCYDRNQRAVLRSLISPLLGRLGADDMPYHELDTIKADLMDVFLEYEDVPSDKEMVIALLDLADGVLSEDIE